MREWIKFTLFMIAALLTSAAFTLLILGVFTQATEQRERCVFNLQEAILGKDELWTEEEEIRLKDTSAQWLQTLDLAGEIHQLNTTQGVLWVGDIYVTKKDCK